MSKAPPLGVRLEPDERAALERAATRDGRSASALVRKVLADWLRAKGYLAPLDDASAGD